MLNKKLIQKMDIEYSKIQMKRKIELNEMKEPRILKIIND